jgi:hypothetical protein
MSPCRLCRDSLQSCAAHTSLTAVYAIGSAALRRGSNGSAGVLVITAHRSRSQERNREDALERLVALIRRAVTPIGPTPVPEPSISALMLTALVGLGGLAWRRRSCQS